MLRCFFEIWVSKGKKYDLLWWKEKNLIKMFIINIYELCIKYVLLCNFIERIFLLFFGIFEVIEMIDKNFINFCM